MKIDSTTGADMADPAVAPAADLPARIALVGNPNTGKTTLFNRLCGVRAETANFPGSTVDVRVGTRQRDGWRVEIVDLPGHYGLNLDRPESKLCKDYLSGAIRTAARPDVLVVVLDATNLGRNLMLASQALQQGLPAVVALNMIDAARRRDATIDVDALEAALGCPVVPLSGKTGEGVDQLMDACRAATVSIADLPSEGDAQAAAVWGTGVARRVRGDAVDDDLNRRWTDRLDVFFTHPVSGGLVFLAVMAGLFYTIFALATVPMDLIDVLFGWLGGLLTDVLPAGPIRDLLVDGVVAGVAGTVVFLPQICLLFFLISLLEGTGYLARAAFLVDRVLRRFGLPGQAFVPMLSAHACAIPAIMSARLIPNERDRLATILVTPFLSCSARLPVYVLLIGFLFHGRPLLAGLAFVGCYAVGALAAVCTAAVVRRTVLAGPSPPMVMELPAYRRPSIRGALLTTMDRAWMFLRKAGTVIVGICIVLWWLGAYPNVDPPPGATALRADAAVIAETDPAGAERLVHEADGMERSHAKANSFIGRIGRTVEPVFEPLGYDWQLTVGVMSSLLAREVFVSTMTVVVSGDEDSEDDEVLDRLLNSTRADGSPLFTVPSAASLLIYYVLAMQCLPTLAVTRREAGSWKWAAVQLGWMTGLAYVLALVTYQVLSAMGVS